MQLPTRSGREPRLINQPPLPLVEVAGAYEGTSTFFYHRLELHADGAGFWAACQLVGDECEVEIGRVKSWETTPNGGIRLQTQKLSSTGETGEVELVEGRFLGGMLHLASPDETSPALSLMRERAVESSRDLLKRAINAAKTFKTQQQY